VLAGFRVRRKLGFRVRVEVELIAGKSTPITKMVDPEAKTAAALPTEVDRGFLSGKIGRAKTTRRGEQKVKFQLFSAQAKDFIEKFVAYADAALGNELHR
jgi:hypothetical protein